MADRDSEIQALLVHLDQLEKTRSAIQRRLKLLMGMGEVRRVRSRFSQQDLDAWAKAK
jgi:predicted transcriptional regulator